MNIRYIVCTVCLMVPMLAPTQLHGQPQPSYTQQQSTPDFRDGYAQGFKEGFRDGNEEEEFERHLFLRLIGEDDLGE